MLWVRRKGGGGFRGWVWRETGCDDRVEQHTEMFGYD